MCDLQVLVSELGEDAAALGACLLAAEKMLEMSVFSGAVEDQFSASRSRSAGA